MVDVVVSTGASIIDMDLFEALGYKHYKGHQDVPDMQLRELYIDRIYDTFIEEEELQACEHTTLEIIYNLETNTFYRCLNGARDFDHSTDTEGDPDLL